MCVFLLDEDRQAEPSNFSAYRIVAFKAIRKRMVFVEELAGGMLQ